MPLARHAVTLQTLKREYFRDTLAADVAVILAAEAKRPMDNVDTLISGTAFVVGSEEQLSEDERILRIGVRALVTYFAVLGLALETGLVPDLLAEPTLDLLHHPAVSRFYGTVEPNPLVQRLAHRLGSGSRGVRATERGGWTLAWSLLDLLAPIQTSRELDRLVALTAQGAVGPFTWEHLRTILESPRETLADRLARPPARVDDLDLAIRGLGPFFALLEELARFPAPEGRPDLAYEFFLPHLRLFTLPAAATRLRELAAVLDRASEAAYPRLELSPAAPRAAATLQTVTERFARVAALAVPAAVPAVRARRRREASGVPARKPVPEPVGVFDEIQYTKELDEIMQACVDAIGVSAARVHAAVRVGGRPGDNDRHEAWEALKIAARQSAERTGGRQHELVQKTSQGEWVAFVGRDEHECRKELEAVFGTLRGEPRGKRGIAYVVAPAMQKTGVLTYVNQKRGYIVVNLEGGNRVLYTHDPEAEAEGGRGSGSPVAALQLGDTVDVLGLHGPQGIEAVKLERRETVGAS